MQLKGGVIIMGSLLWQDDLHRNDKVRCSWRSTSLNLNQKILVRLPIRYGRYSTDKIYTMVFETDCEKPNALGTGYVVPFKNNPIGDLDVLICEARMMAKAEGMECGFVGKKSDGIWASMGILINKRVPPKTKKQIISRWAKELNNDEDTSKCRIPRKKLSINKDGELQIDWPTSFYRAEQSTIDEGIDFLIATSTKSKKYRGNSHTKYPSPAEIAKKVTQNDLQRRYFMNNWYYRITTFQDNSVIDHLKLSP